jgi:HSP20 family protein
MDEKTKKKLQKAGIIGLIIGFMLLIMSLLFRKKENVDDGPRRSPIEVRAEKEPLEDVILANGEVKVVLELPGVEKKDIKLRTTETVITISVDTSKRRYHKEIELPASVDPKQVKASYKNGVLEVTLKRKEIVKPKANQ